MFLIQVLLSLTLVSVPLHRWLKKMILACHARDLHLRTVLFRACLRSEPVPETEPVDLYVHPRSIQQGYNTRRPRPGS